jgi:hypothetical protein
LSFDYGFHCLLPSKYPLMIICLFLFIYWVLVWCFVFLLFDSGSY